MKKMGGLSSLMDKLPSQLTAKAAGADMDRPSATSSAWKASSAA
jgi:signal recognition particle GTPase